jgi:glycosyltransferase involved in cell wall biosynthesis
MRIAYLANSFPEVVESYVYKEIEELREQGAEVTPYSIRFPKLAAECSEMVSEAQYVFPLRLSVSLLATWLLLKNCWRLRDLAWRLVRGRESLQRKLRTFGHTWLGAYLAILLRQKRVQHIHVHHGYFSSWVGMIAARLLRITFSMTLHGSDLLVRGDYLDTKLAGCSFCFTISDFNRDYILERYPTVPANKIFVHRLGVDTGLWRSACIGSGDKRLSILSVGRLHAVKNHEFLLCACYLLKQRGVQIRCRIAGEGQERQNLEEVIVKLGLEREVELLGHIERRLLPSLYVEADAVALTSRSEGVPVTLMEAMAMERIVIAPRISGIPELVQDGETGFLYAANSMQEFLVKMELIAHQPPSLQSMRSAARRRVIADFNLKTNLARTASHFLSLIGKTEPHKALRDEPSHAHPVLQQI